MSQSKQAAICSECEAKGPRRSKAIKEGWVRRSFGGTDKPDWLCPTCGEEHRKIPPKPSPRLRPGAARALAMAMGLTQGLPYIR